MFLRELLVEAQEVAEAPPHREGLVAEHGQRGLKRPFADVGVSSVKWRTATAAAACWNLLCFPRPGARVRLLRYANEHVASSAAC